MINKKVCMLGAFAVGKTALVQRYVHSIFSDRYLSTVGVKISKADIHLDDHDISLVLWDLEGKDVYTEVNMAYLRGSMGCLLVADGTRRETLDIAMELRYKTIELVGPIPHIMLLNKRDLEDEWELTENDTEVIKRQGIPVLETSAKTGQSVEEAFINLTKAMM
jgi:small GTP-binding protein